MKLSQKIKAPWLYEEEHIEDVPIDGDTFIRPRLWGTNLAGDPTLIAEFTVPVDPEIVRLILNAPKFAAQAQARGYLKKPLSKEQMLED